MSERTQPRQIGLVVHPARSLDGPLDAVLGWGERHDVTIVQVPELGQERRVADPGEAEDCDLIVSIGGDGTTLAGVRSAILAGCPALGIACGSLGALTTVAADKVDRALDRFAAGDWHPRRLPVLRVARDGAADLHAVNDIVVARAGIGQVRVTVEVDGVLYARLAGDGCIVCTPLGSSAYSLAAGGPLLAPDTPAFALTPLPSHGGFRQPLVVGESSRVALEITTGLGGARTEIDGQIVDASPGGLEITLRRDVATLVGYDDQEPMFTALRRRRIIVDSPRIVAENERDE